MLRGPITVHLVCVYDGGIQVWTGKPETLATSVTPFTPALLKKTSPIHCTDERRLNSRKGEGGVCVGGGEERNLRGIMRRLPSSTRSKTVPDRGFGWKNT